MNKNINILISLPIILVILYFMPFLGIVLIILRLFIKKMDSYKTVVIFFVIGLLLLVPKLLSVININIVDNIVSTDIYKSLISYSKLLITISIILVIVIYIFKRLFNKLNDFGKKYMEEDLRKETEIRKANDMVMQEKREKAKNTQVIRCPYCGSLNTLTGKVGTCEFCRRSLEGKIKD